MVLRTENLVKKYGKRTVVSEVSFNVRQGEIVGLLGPNGAGKTTSFYMTTGLVVPNGGKIFLNDEEITKYPVYKRAHSGIAYLAQEASVFRKMTVEENIASILEMTGKPKSYQREKLESLISEFRLQKVRKNLGDRLSGGERRRTEIARCLAIDPKFIMLDEPFAGVDPIAVEDIQRIVWKLKYRNIGILITDHNVEETLCITDRAYLLFEGKILFEGTPEQLAYQFCAPQERLLLIVSRRILEAERSRRLGSPCQGEQGASSSLGGFGNGSRSDLINLCQFLNDIRNIRRLVALASERGRRKVGSVGFERKAIERHLPKHLRKR